MGCRGKQGMDEPPNIIPKWVPLFSVPENCILPVENALLLSDRLFDWHKSFNTNPLYNSMANSGHLEANMAAGRHF